MERRCRLDHFPGQTDALAAVSARTIGELAVEDVATASLQDMDGTE